MPNPVNADADTNNDDKEKSTICAFDKGFCADGPALTQDGCFPQLTAYQVNVNASFVVTGAQAGSFSAGKEDGPGGMCIPFPPGERDPRLVSRIPLRPAPGADVSFNECKKMADQMKNPLFPADQTTSPTADGYYFERFDPALKPTIIDGKPAVEHFTLDNAAADREA